MQEVSKSMNTRETRKTKLIIATSGEKPGKGIYVCTKCQEIIHLKDSDAILPPCSNCDSVKFY